MKAALGLRLLAIFFAFGAAVCGLTLLLLSFPGTSFDSLWRLNPEAQTSLQSLGKLSILLMSMVGLGCGLAAVGLWRGRRWGMRLALIILSVNIIGDLLNALARHDYRALIGLPIGGVMIWYLARRHSHSKTFGA